MTLYFVRPYVLHVITLLFNFIHMTPTHYLKRQTHTFSRYATLTSTHNIVTCWHILKLGCECVAKHIINDDDIILFYLASFRNSSELVQPKIPPTLSFSGIYRKSFICRGSSTNSWLKALLYFTIGSIWLYVRFKLCNSTIIYIWDTQHLDIICIRSYFDIFPFL